MVSCEDGTRLSGVDAPVKRDLERWLDEHPSYMVNRQYTDKPEDSVDRVGSTISGNCCIHLFGVNINLFNAPIQIHQKSKTLKSNIFSK